jgi:hypothetical protein
VRVHRVDPRGDCGGPVSGAAVVEVDPAYTLDAYAAASGERGLSRGLIWVIPGLALATAYFVHLFRSMRGKAKSHDYEH